jgi:hypothetical protein
MTVRPKQQAIIGPVVVERSDWDDGSIHYELWDHNPGNYHRICSISDDDNRHAKRDAEILAKAANCHLGFSSLGCPV